MNTTIPLLTALLLTLATGYKVQAQTSFDFWDDPETLPTLDQYAFAPLPHQADPATGDEYHHPGDETMEQDGQAYKVVQWFHDTEFTVTAPVGKYFLALIGQFYPTGTVDITALMSAVQLVEVEIDGEVFAVGTDKLTPVADFPFPGVELVAYNFLPRFNEPGQHTLRYRWRQVENFYYTFPFAQFNALNPEAPAEDPLGLGGRRVLVAEREGDPLDGDMVVTYNVTVEDVPSAVEGVSWGGLKAKRVLGE